MIRSRLLDGVRTESAEAVRGQVWAYDHSTVVGELNRRVLRNSSEAPADAMRHARDDGLVIPMSSDDWRAAKLARVLRHLGLRLSGEPSAAELVDLCLDAEGKAVALLRQLQGPRRFGKGREAFEGRDVSHLAHMSCAASSRN